MKAKTIRTIMATALSAGLLGWAGCDSGGEGPGAAVDAGAPGLGPGPGGPPGGGRSSPLRNLMRKLDDRRPGGLTREIKEGLKPDQPDWTGLQAKAGEYAQLTGELAKFDPPRGSKESWDQLTSAFHESATDLEQAVRSRKRDEAVAASDELSTSCMKCHREHRRGPGGGPPPGGFGPPGGLPPGGGPPPDGGPPPGGPPPG